MASPLLQPVLSAVQGRSALLDETFGSRMCGSEESEGKSQRAGNRAMLVLSRKVGERVWIGENIAITIVKVSGGGVRIGIEAPTEMPVVREELKLRLQAERSATNLDDEVHDSAPR